MLDQYAQKGIDDACARFGVKRANVQGPGFLDRAKSFGQGQMDAAKSLFHNMRGGMGGQFAPDIAPSGWQAPSGFDPGLGRAMHRQRALGNMKTLAPSLLAGGALYMLHRHNKAKEQQQQMQQQQMAQMGGYPPPM